MKGISIIIPIYNREKTVLETVKSVLNQSYNGDFEVILSDDGSTDKSLELIQAISDPHITIVTKNDEFKGASAARNRGIKKAKFDYISFLDSDDYYLPDFLSRMSKVLDNNPDIGYVFCKSKKEFINNNIPIISDWTRKKMNYFDRRYHVLNRAYCINTNVIMFRKEIFDEVGLFDTQLSNGNDSDMWIRISEKFKGKFCDFFGATYRMNICPNQLTHNSNSIRNKCSVHIFTKALERYIINKEKKTELIFLITKQLLYANNSNKGKKGFYARLNAEFKLLIAFPITYIKYLACYLFNL